MKHTEDEISRALENCTSFSDALIVFDGYMDGFIYENGDESYGRAYDIPRSAALYIHKALQMAIDTGKGGMKGGDIHENK